MSDFEFSHHAVAYLDILGFSKFVEAAETDTGKLQKLDKLFNEVIPRQISTPTNDESFPSKLGLECLSFSDSIIISAPVDQEYSKNYPSLIAVSIKSIQIAHAILDMGLLVRGAINVGNVYRTDSNITGTGYQKAVCGEKNAINPQIVLTKSAEQDLNIYIKNEGTKFAIFAKNELGQVILDSIYPHPTYLPDPQADVNEYFKQYQNTIIENLAHDDPKAKAKWIWFAGLFNANVRYFSEIKDKSLTIDQELQSIAMNYLNPPAKDSSWMEPFNGPAITCTLKK
ncbi:MAG: hypothetical protein KGI54_06590 [Pseudomonadota bacterium]|nr:hypothetical protein [Pseudomonadota bacterium]